MGSSGAPAVAVVCVAELLTYWLFGRPTLDSVLEILNLLYPVLEQVNNFLILDCCFISYMHV